MTIDPLAALTKPWLPEDPDVDVGHGGLPVHLRGAYLFYVAVGGFVGTGLREGLSLWFPPVNRQMNWTILLVNVAGAFLLAFLIEILANRMPEKGRRRTLRLLLGTGVLGGFTTYSTFATGAAELIRQGSPGTAIGYSGLTLGLGLLASFAGMSGALKIREWYPR
ncbi:MAG: CrcB family protein [Allobranchiibius sp.]